MYEMNLNIQPCPSSKLFLKPLWLWSLFYLFIFNKLFIRLSFFLYWDTIALQSCYFLLYSDMNQLYVYKYPLFFEFPSYLGHHRIVEFPMLYSRLSLVIYFMHSSVYMSISISQFILYLLFPPLSVHMTVLYICIPISAMQTSSSIPFF